MSAFARVILHAVGVCLVCSGPVRAQDTPRLQYDSLAQSTRLTAEGKTPFHLRIDAEVYDLNGHNPRPAAVEEWWASPKQHRIELTSDAGKRVLSPLQKTPDPEARRADYLLRQLLDQVTSPLPLQPPPDFVVSQGASYNVAGINLQCLETHQKAAWDPSTHGMLPPKTLCLDDKHELRVLPGLGTVTTRNRIGQFHNTSVPLEVGISYGGLTAITGATKTLAAFDPATTSWPEFAQNVSLNETQRAASVFVSSGVAAGKRLSGIPPVYPDAAKLGHVSGAVVLVGMISPDGKMTSLDAIASPSPMLAEAAKEAVRTLTYSPFSVNGEPVSVETTITVNFNIGR